MRWACVVVALAACSHVRDDAGVGGVEVFANNVAPPETGASAGFYDSCTADVSNCTITQDGPCAVSVCKRGEGGDGGGPCSLTPFAAGEITVSGGPIMMQMANDSSYEASQAAVWSGGETLTVTSSGDSSGVPPFHEMVTAPSPFIMTNTKFGEAVTRSTELELLWTGGTTGRFTVDLLHDIVSEPDYESAECTTDIGAGHIEIPATTLGTLGAGDTDLSFANVETTSFIAGGFNAVFTARWEAGSNFGSITLQ